MFIIPQPLLAWSGLNREEYDVSLTTPYSEYQPCDQYHKNIGTNQKFISTYQKLTKLFVLSSYILQDFFYIEPVASKSIMKHTQYTFHY